MKKLVGLVLLVFVSACSVNWVTVLTWAKQGLQPVCALGQDTLSPEACTDTLDGLDVTIAVVQRDPAHAKDAVHKFLADIEAKHPDVTEWLSWIRA